MNTNELHHEDCGTQLEGNYAMKDGFRPASVSPTCEGTMDWHALTKMPKPEFLEISKNIMRAIWNSPRPVMPGFFPTINNTDDLTEALNNGWAYNANEADTMLTFFADIRAIHSNGKLIGIGTQTPDGMPIRNGYDLVAWRDTRWIIH